MPILCQVLAYDPTRPSATLPDTGRARATILPEGDATHALAPLSSKERG